uniref:Uncharacterized protein n=1 Tax=Arundo donax TaxID=35708 RepID=A0A0A9BX92_ARUDO
MSYIPYFYAYNLVLCFTLLICYVNGIRDSKTN